MQSLGGSDSTINTKLLLLLLLLLPVSTGLVWNMDTSTWTNHDELQAEWAADRRLVILLSLRLCVCFLISWCIQDKWHHCQKVRLSHLRNIWTSVVRCFTWYVAVMWSSRPDLGLDDYITASASSWWVDKRDKVDKLLEVAQAKFFGLGLGLGT